MLDNTMKNITPFPIERVREDDFQECLDRLHQAWVNIPNVMSKKEFDWYKEYCSRCDLPEEVDDKYWFIDNDFNTSGLQSFHNTLDRRCSEVV